MFNYLCSKLHTHTNTHTHTHTHSQTLSTHRMGSSDVAPLTLTIRMSARPNNRCACFYASVPPFSDTAAFSLSTSGILFLTCQLLSDSIPHCSFYFRSARLTCLGAQSESLKPGVHNFFKKSRNNLKILGARKVT